MLTKYVCRVLKRDMGGKSELFRFAEIHQLWGDRFLLVSGIARIVLTLVLVLTLIAAAFCFWNEDRRNGIGLIGMAMLWAFIRHLVGSYLWDSCGEKFIQHLPKERLPIVIESCASSACGLFAQSVHAQWPSDAPTHVRFQTYVVESSSAPRLFRQFTGESTRPFSKLSREERKLLLQHAAKAISGTE